MKVKELFKHITSTNKLQEALQSRERAGVEIYVEDSQVGHECHSLYEFKHYLESEYCDEFVEKVMNADFVKTYNNTLSASLEFKFQYSDGSYTQKVDLFVDMGGF